MFFTPLEYRVSQTMELVTVVGILTAATFVLSVLSLGMLSMVRRMKGNGGRPEPPNANRARRNIPGGSNDSD